MLSSFLVIQVLFRERLKHHTREKKRSLCNKRNQVHWADSGEIEPRYNWDDFIVIVSVVIVFIFF